MENYRLQQTASMTQRRKRKLAISGGTSYHAPRLKACRGKQALMILRYQTIAPSDLGKKHIRT
jgi:hypothetical protein